MRILAVGAHPDDVEFGCAPILIQEARAGHEVRILVTSKGEAASAGTPEERAQEAREAAKIIGARDRFPGPGRRLQHCLHPGQRRQACSRDPASSVRTSSWLRTWAKISIPIMQPWVNWFATRLVWHVTEDCRNF